MNDIACSVERAREQFFSRFGTGKWKLRALAAGGFLLTTGIVLYVLNRLALIDVPGELVAVLICSGVMLVFFG